MYHNNRRALIIAVLLGALTVVLLSACGVADTGQASTAVPTALDATADPAATAEPDATADPAATPATRHGASPPFATDRLSALHPVGRFATGPTRASTADAHDGMARRRDARCFASPACGGETRATAVAAPTGQLRPTTRIGTTERRGLNRTCDFSGRHTATGRPHAAAFPWRTFP